MAAEIKLNLNKPEVFEEGARLVTLIAYPGERDADALQGGLHQSLCSMVLRARFDSDPEWASSPQLIMPIYAFRDERLIARDLKPLKRRIRDRMVAGKMAIALLKEAQTGKLPELPKRISRMTLNQLSEMVLPDSGQADPEKVEARIWRASIPVIHLCAAVQMAISEAKRIGLVNFNIGAFIQSRALIEWVVESAEEFERLFAKSRYRKVDPKDLIRVRLMPKVRKEPKDPPRAADRRVDSKGQNRVRLVKE